jgi:transcriptional repressor NrdR
VVKRSGVTEVFDREKVISGARKACQGRPVAVDDLAKIGHAVEEHFRAAGKTEIASDTIGLAVLPHLRQLDAIAYLRFASVYKAFQNVEDFQHELDTFGAIPPADRIGVTS